MEDLKEKEPGCRTGPLKPIHFFEGNGITQCAPAFCLKGATGSGGSTICVCCPELLGFPLHIMMIFIYCGREERMRICHDLNRGNSTPVPLTAHLWLAALYCPPHSGAAGQCVCVCVCVCKDFPAWWVTPHLAAPSSGSCPLLSIQYLLEARAKESGSLQC